MENVKMENVFANNNILEKIAVFLIAIVTNMEFVKKIIRFIFIYTNIYYVIELLEY